MEDTTYKRTKEDKAYLRQSNKLRRKFESDFKKDVEAYLFRIRTNVINALNQYNEGFVLANINELIKDDVFEKSVINHDVSIGVQFAQFTHDRLIKIFKEKKDPTVSIGFFSETWRKQMQEYAVNSSSSLIKLIDETTRTRVRESLAESVKKGHGAKKIASSLSKNIAFSRKRATVIARTETTAGQEYGSYLGAKPYENKLTKKWLTAQDGRVRDWHASMNGKEVGFNDKFSVKGVPMKYPCDPSGGASNVINCRCTALYIPNRSVQDEPIIQESQTEAVNSLNPFYSMLAGLLIAEVVD